MHASNDACVTPLSVRCASSEQQATRPTEDPVATTTHWRIAAQALLFSAPLLLAACGGSDDPPPQTPAPPAPTPAPPPPPAVVAPSITAQPAAVSVTEGQTQIDPATMPTLLLAALVNPVRQRHRVSTLWLKILYLRLQCLVYDHISGLYHWEQEAPALPLPCNNLKPVFSNMFKISDHSVKLVT